MRTLPCVDATDLNSPSHSFGPSPSDLRAKAILLLFAIYGLRSSEVAQLRFSDFDWYSEMFTVRRARRGGIQQFPIQFEVGEAIIRHLQHGRPRSATDYVFGAAQLPPGRIRPAPMWQLVSTRMLALGIRPEQLGPHSLRPCVRNPFAKEKEARFDRSPIFSVTGTLKQSVFTRG